MCHTCTSPDSMLVVLPSPIIRAKTFGILRTAFKKSLVSCPPSVNFIPSILLFVRHKKDSFRLEVGAVGAAAAAEAIWNNHKCGFLKQKVLTRYPRGAVNNKLTALSFFPVIGFLEPRASAPFFVPSDSYETSALIGCLTVMKLRIDTDNCKQCWRHIAHTVSRLHWH